MLLRGVDVIGACFLRFSNGDDSQASGFNRPANNGGLLKGDAWWTVHRFTP